MFTAIAIKLVTVLVGFIFEQFLIDNFSVNNSSDNITIEGAPDWYMNKKYQQEGNLYSYYTESSVALSDKNSVKEKFESRVAKKLKYALNRAVDKKIYAYLPIKNERDVAQRIKNLDDVDEFVYIHFKYDKIAYDRAKKQFYFMGHIKNDDLNKYLLDKVESIVIGVSDEKSEELFDKLHQKSGQSSSLINEETDGLYDELHKKAN